MGPRRHHSGRPSAPCAGRLLLFGVVLSLTASACAGGGGVFASTTTTRAPAATTATTSGGILATAYPRGAVEAYVEGCARDGDPDFCSCSIREFQQRLTFEEFLALNESDLQGVPVVQEVTRICLREITAATSTTAAPTTTTTTTLPVALTLEDKVDVTIDDLDSFWAEELPAAYGVAYEDVSATIPYYPSQGDLPRCGTEELSPSVYEENAFYCGPGDFVAWDAEGLIPELYDEFGDFAVSLVLAHEWGHAIQARAGVGGLTIVKELQADCFAGAWTGEVSGGSRTFGLAPGDLEEAMAGYLLFRDPPGTSPRDDGAHGSGFDRLNAFQYGFFNGVGSCVAFETDPDLPLIVAIPLTQEDLVTGGDLPYDEAATLLSGSLEAYWAITYPELFGSDWVPVTSSVPYIPSSDDLPQCGFGEPDPAAYEYTAFYCAADDFVAWDDEALFPDLYRSIGDFAIGMVLGHEWATAAQSRAGLETDGVHAELQADCLTGAWTSALVDFENPTGIVLSAGDLDEGIAGFLTLGDDPDDASSTGTPFERFNAFQEGFFSGPAACVGG